MKMLGFSTGAACPRIQSGSRTNSGWIAVNVQHEQDYPLATAWQAWMWKAKQRCPIAKKALGAPRHSSRPESNASPPPKASDSPHKSVSHFKIPHFKISLLSIHRTVINTDFVSGPPIFKPRFTMPPCTSYLIIPSLVSSPVKWA